MLPDRFLHLADLNNGLIARKGRSGTVSFNSYILRTIRRTKGEGFGHTRRPTLFALISGQPRHSNRTTSGNRVTRAVFIQVFFSLVIVRIRHTLQELFNFNRISIRRILNHLLRTVNIRVQLNRVPNGLNIGRQRIRIGVCHTRGVRRFFVPVRSNTKIFTFRRPHGLYSRNVNS